MARTYNIGTECYALLTSNIDAEMLLPVKIVILDKYRVSGRMVYKVKIKEILENNISILKDSLNVFKVSTNIKSDNKNILIKKVDLDQMSTMKEIMDHISDKAFYLEDNYITLDREGLKDLYVRFVKYMINYHYSRLFKLTSRSFLAGTPLFENQKDTFMRRVNRLGFGDYFERNNVKIDI